MRQSFSLHTIHRSRPGFKILLAWMSLLELTGRVAKEQRAAQAKLCTSQQEAETRMTRNRSFLCWDLGTSKLELPGLVFTAAWGPPFSVICGP